MSPLSNSTSSSKRLRSHLTVAGAVSSLRESYRSSPEAGISSSVRVSRKLGDSEEGPPAA
jgi:hypothetical protein